MRSTSEAAATDGPEHVGRLGAAFWNWLVPGFVAVVFPGYVLLTNHLIPFANNFHCDPWHYFGFFFLADNLQVFRPSSRMLSRIPEIWIGNFATKIAPGIAADYVNFLILYVGSILALYFTALRFFGRFPALIVAVFFAFNALVIGDLSVTYTGPSILYNSVAIWLAAEAQRSAASRRTIALVLMGAVLAFSVCGHLYGILCAFAIPLYALRPPGRALTRSLSLQIAEIAVKTAAGIVGGIILIALVNRFLLGGQLIFFTQQLELVGKIKLERYQIAGWFFQACRGAVYLLMILLPAIQLVALAYRRRLDAFDWRVLLANAVPLVVGVALFFDDRLGGFFLQYDYYYVLVLPHIAISLAALFGRAPLSMAALGGVVAAYLIVSALAILPDIEQIEAAFLSPDNAAFSLGIVILACAAAGFASLSRGSRRVAVSLSVTLLLIGCLGFAVRPQRMGRLVWQEGHRADIEYGANNYKRIREAMSFLASHRLPSAPVFWVSIDDGYWETIALPRSYDNCIVEMHLPTLETAAVDFTAGRYMVLADPNEALVAQANAVFADRHLRFAELARKKIEGGDTRYFVVIGRLMASDDQRP